MKIRIYYEDTDAGGIVYHTNYLKYCERARSEYFFSSNIDIMSENSHFVVKNLEANFVKPAYLGDLIEIKTSILEIKNASIKLKQEVFKDDIKLFSMNILLVFVKNGKVTRMDEKHRLVFDKISVRGN